MLYTTLNEIRECKPCQKGWGKLLKGLGKTKADDEKLALISILETNGIDDAIWALRTQGKSTRIEFAVFRAYKVLGVYESKYPKDNRVRYAIEIASNWENEDTSDISSAAEAAFAAYDAADDAYDAAYTAYAAAFAAADDAADDAAGAAIDAYADAADAAKEQFFIEFIQKRKSCL